MPMSTFMGRCAQCMFEATLLYNLSALPLHVVRKATSSAHAANLFFALDERWVTGESLVERFVDQP